MRIKNQFRISIVIFIVITAIIATSVFVTEQQTAQLNSKEAVARDILTNANNLVYISSEYFLYDNSSDLNRWQTEFSTLSTDLAKISVLNLEQKVLLNNAKGDSERLNSSWAVVVSYLENTPRNVTVRIIPEFQSDWSTMSSQNQALISDAQQLSQGFRSQIDQSTLTSVILILALLGLFAAYFVTNYLITYRNTLKSISELKDGMAVVGSGNLNYSLKADKKDEIGEIARSFNRTTASLKAVTASKADLEREVEERKKAEEAVKESEERLKRSQEIAHLGSWELDLKADKLTWSDEVYRIFGLKPQEFGATYEAFLANVHPDDRSAVEEAYSGSLRERKEGYEIEHRVVRKDNGEIRIVHEKCTHVKDGSGNVIRSIGMVHDITEQKKAEAQLDQYAKNLERLVEERTKSLKDAERLAAIGATAGMVGHDIRNPLQAITSDVYLLESDLASMPDGENKESMKESLNGIEENVEYVNKIVQDLQDFAKPIHPVAREVDVRKILCEDALSKNGIPENIGVTCRVEKAAKKLITDPDLLKRILCNLVNNAIQAMPDGGKLDTYAYQEAGDTVFVVQDTGAGIPEAIRSELFKPLFTTKSKGQGFGLAVVKRMTEALGGTVTFESEVDKGTKFIIRLPSQEAKR